ncbi:amidohydrolase family protein [Nocardioides daeguensis]|uniref:Amidohydrolase-related domain-containing protein n=1 Tax=Nocardioides daeguensis TaxID=908359 RepID=A0ABP6W5M7_9ACTN|nr:amidohydrolase family protein [Nocardioides daeguensis]MBV6729810.1 amidohydrolase family protein [Nocardioides daeguensis]MCR1775381.1 amidohydrolase family protein [Nocardioides daeguensis]
MTAPASVRSDVHTHIWAPSHLSGAFRVDLDRIRPGGAAIDASPEAHRASDRPERTIVVAFDGAHSGLEVPDHFVAAYVDQDRERLIGYCSVNPVARDPRDAITRAVDELGLRGVKIAPTYQAFDPLGPEAFRLYEEIAARELPVLWHQGAAFVRNSVLSFAPPRLIDDVARRFPEMKIVIAHAGSPWPEECLAVVRKHPQVFADISGIVARPSLIRSVLTSATELGCSDRLLFGTDWPFATVAEVATSLQAVADDDDLTPATRSAASSLLARDSVAALGF